MNTTQHAMCRHCGKHRASRPRGLCWGCYYAPGVRDLYPPTNSRFVGHGVRDGLGARPLPASPTRATPGSAAKLRILEQRAEAGLTLWHPEDPVIGRVTRWGVPIVHCPFPEDA